MWQILGELAALSAAFLWSISSTIFTTVGKRIGAMSLNAIRIAISLALFLFFHFLFYGTLFPYVSSEQLLVLSFSGIIGLAVGDLAYFGSLVELGPRKAILVASMAPIFSLIGGVFMLNEVPSFLSSVGIFLVLLGVWIVIVEGRVQGSTPHSGNVLLGVILGIFAAAGQGFGVVLSKYGMLFAGTSLDPLSTTVIRVSAALPMIWLTVLLWKGPAHISNAFRDMHAMKLVLIGSLIGPFVGLWLSMISIKYAEVGIASTLMSMTPIMIIPVVYFMRGERVDLRGIIGACISVAGVAMIFLY